MLLRAPIATLAALVLALAALAPPAPVAADEDDEPITVPFEDMTDDQWNELQERKARFQLAWAQWANYDALTCVYQVTYEARLEAWRKAIAAWNDDPSLPDPGDRPSQQDLPPRPTLPRPGAMPDFQGCG